MRGSEFALVTGVMMVEGPGEEGGLFGISAFRLSVFSLREGASDKEGIWDAEGAWNEEDV